jgi:phosphotransferase system  glucose/maltose/N-acetylglucosamine-specific IIC component
MNFLLKFMSFLLSVVAAAAVWFANTLSTHQGSVFINNVITTYIVMIFTKVRSIKLLILCTCLVLLVIMNLICLSRFLVFSCSEMGSDPIHSERRGVFIFTVM